MVRDTNFPAELRAIAHQTMLDAGFVPDIPADVVREV